MPPKVKITKEDIINTTVDIVRNDGAESINARNIATKLKCSTQPIFSNFTSKEELRLAVIKKAEEMCNEYINAEISKEQYPPYKASGIAYIRFAKEEKELFKLLYMRNRNADDTMENPELNNKMENMVQSNTGLKGDDIKLFHLEMWAYVHGIATMFATDFLDLSWELVSKMLTDSYQGLKKQYEVKD